MIGEARGDMGSRVATGAVIAGGVASVPFASYALKTLVTGDKYARSIIVSDTLIPGLGLAATAALAGVALGLAPRFPSTGSATGDGAARGAAAGALGAVPVAGILGMVAWNVENVQRSAKLAGTIGLMGLAGVAAGAVAGGAIGAGLGKITD